MFLNETQRHMVILNSPTPLWVLHLLHTLALPHCTRNSSYFIDLFKVNMPFQVCTKFVVTILSYYTEYIFKISLAALQTTYALPNFEIRHDVIA